MERKSKTFITRVIEGGRITIPKDVRKKLEIEDGNYVHVYIAKLDLLRMSMHEFFAPERVGAITKKQVSATKFKEVSGGVKRRKKEV